MPNVTTMAPLAMGGVVALGALFVKGKARLELSRAKHRSLAGHARMSRWVAGLIPFYEYTEDRFFRCDDPPEAVAEQRAAGFWQLSRLYRDRFALTGAMTGEIATAISDMQFTRAYRVPFQFSRFVRQHLPIGSVLASSSGVTVTDLDGNVFYDLTGSYGVNLFGYDFYKSCIAAGAERVKDLGPVLGAYHPVVAYNVRRLREISGLDEISFHMSGTEAVMQAVRLARYHTGRSHLVRFCGAYHGWWGDVQPGIGNPIPAESTYTLADMSEHTLHALRTRRNIACVLVNPIQAMHPNGSPPGDSALVDSARHAHFDRAAYTAWLKQLRVVCNERGIVLIFDEVFAGFRLGIEGARRFFDVQPDLITYGKSLGGGLPVGVLCGRSALMKRYRDHRPVDICLARGTFNAHPYVMGTMHEFLQRLESPEIQALYTDIDARWDGRANALNDRLRAERLPITITNLSTIWTMSYTTPSRYNWMLQYYLRAEGVALSWVGTGRLIFSLNYGDEEFAAVMQRIVAACNAMQRDGWWWVGEHSTNGRFKRQVLRELASAALFGKRSRFRPAIG